jgi:hypothetical protein
MGPARVRGGPATVLAALVALVATTAAGCATYIDRVGQATRAAGLGNYADAVSDMNGLLGVQSADELPNQWSGDRPLAALERGSLQQALGRYAGATRDLSAAEQELELLDLRADAIGALGSYLYSDSVKTYKTPPTERLALNAVNLLNYLAVGDLDGAAVEARRFQVMRDYLDSQNIAAAGPARLGAYLSGFVFERRGEGDRALRYYEEALAGGPLDSLVAPVVRLAQSNPYRGPRLTDALSRATNATGGGPPEPELLVVLSLARVPHKEPKRIPIGAAVGLAGTYASGDIDWLKYGATKVVVYPDLVSTPSALGPPTVRVDGSPVALEELTDLGAAIRTEYKEAEPKIIAAALTRMAARAGMAEGIRAAGRKEDKLLGDILSLLFETAMVAFDRPDTRSWTMLPDRVLVARVPAAPGPRTVEVTFGGNPGAGRTLSVEVPPAGYAAVVVTEPR